MRLTLHARIEITIAATLLVGSCGADAPRQFTDGDFDRLDVADVNARNAIYQINALESRVSELEARLQY